MVFTSRSLHQTRRPLINDSKEMALGCQNTTANTSTHIPQNSCVPVKLTLSCNSTEPYLRLISNLALQVKNTTSCQPTFLHWTTVNVETTPVVNCINSPEHSTKTYSNTTLSARKNNYFKILHLLIFNAIISLN